MFPDGALVARFGADLDALVGREVKLGLAVSGGPDSLALLLLAASCRPGAVEAATVDHGLRAESKKEAEMVEAICRRLDIPHATLRADEAAPKSNLQAWARELRYRLLGEWGAHRGLATIAVAHHADDQAETLLMRLARGSGIGGLAGARPIRQLGSIALIRPLLGWRRSELVEIVEQAGLDPVRDPSNIDERFDRSRARALLDATGWLDPRRLADAASHCRDAEEALAWAADQEIAKRSKPDGNAIILDPGGLPREIRRRLLLLTIERMTGENPPGPKLIAALDALETGATTTLCGLKLEGGATWRLTPAPPRR